MSSPDVQLEYPLIVYDDSCFMCSRFVRFALARDQGLFYVSGPRNPRLADWLDSHDVDPEESVIVLLSPEEYYTAADAVSYIWHQLNKPIPQIASLIDRLPNRMRHTIYRAIAKNRKRFQHEGNCPRLSSELRNRML